MGGVWMGWVRRNVISRRAWPAISEGVRQKVDRYPQRRATSRQEPAASNNERRSRMKKDNSDIDGNKTTQGDTNEK